MPISIFSRYSGNTVASVMDKNSVTRPTIIINPPDEPVTYNISTYTWQRDDQIDYLAYSAYGDETQWWRIADANPEILFWNDVAPGAEIRVPRA